MVYIIEINTLVYVLTCYKTFKKMTKREKYRIMDLLFSKYKESTLCSKISQGTKIDFYTVHSLSKDLLNEGFLFDYLEIALKDFKLIPLINKNEVY